LHQSVASFERRFFEASTVMYPYAVLTFFAVYLASATFDLRTSERQPALHRTDPVEREEFAEHPPTIISGLPEDAGTLRR
jgi:hypothetical protein